VSNETSGSAGRELQMSALETTKSLAQSVVFLLWQKLTPIANIIAEGCSTTWQPSQLL